jgi:hypothetical protein
MEFLAEVEADAEQVGGSVDTPCTPQEASREATGVLALRC